MNFKTKLSRLIDYYGGYGNAVRIDEYNKMIRYGALGELGDDHYLFIYRDLFRNAAYYGAVIFLNKPDEMGNPVRVYCIEQDGVEQTRNIYIRAALYFLQQEFQNTMDVAGKIKDVFELAKEKINRYIDRPAPANKELEDFNFDVSGQKIHFRQIKAKTFTRKFESRTLQEQLAKLKSPADTDSVPDNKSDADKEENAKTKARLGLSLKVDYIGMTEGKKMVFQPVVVPVKYNGLYGNPRKVIPTDVSGYEFMDLSPSLESFLEHFAALDHHLFSDSLKTKIVNQLYGSQLVQEMLALPDELKFCRPGNIAKGYQPLHTITFKTLAVRFAPSLTKETIFSIRLSFTTGDKDKKTILDAGEDYTIQITDRNILVFFTSPKGEHYLALPDNYQHFHSFFKFLEAGQEFYLFDFQDVLSALQEVESDFLRVDTEVLKKYNLTLKPSPVLRILSNDPVQEKKERIEVFFDYRGEINKFLEKHPDKEVFTYEQDKQFESMCIQLLQTDPLLKQEIDYDNRERSVCYYFYFREGDFFDWVVDRGKVYLEKGFRIYIAKWKRYVGAGGSRINISMHSDIDWLAFNATVHDPITGKGLEIDTIDLENRLVTDKQGRLHLLTEEEIDKLTAIYRYGERHGNMFRIPTRNHILIDKLYDEKMEEMPALKKTLQAGKKLKKFQRIKEYQISSLFKGQLRTYQHEGFKWLNFLQEYSFAGCLADDMGLGKTVQTLALLQTLKDKKNLDTSLLVLPVSAIPNWEAEIEKFTSLTYHRHIGSNRDKDTAGWTEKDLVLTSYATMRNDIEMLSEFQFDYIILDESQNIKNHTSLVSRAARVLRGNNRLALSGTPIENTTMELWSLFDFLIPGYLGTANWFGSQFANAIEKEQDTQQADLLKKMIYPFIMRRKKEEVEMELPEKTEIVSKLRMEDEQASLYAETARYYREEIEHQIDEKGVSQSSMKILEGMLRLRQMCLFPGLVDDKFKTIPSAKFDHLTGLMEDILSEGHKVLVFSQFVEVLKHIRGYFDEANIEYSYIDGSVSVKKREQTIKEFQEDENRRVFLLSLKAGGVAINLTAADYVIIFDPWWNPAVEAQAIDRSHRIGQTRKVLVYRMVVEGSIEEKMLQLQEEKKALVENLITSDSRTFKNLKKEDILNLFS